MKRPLHHLTRQHSASGAWGRSGRSVPPVPHPPTRYEWALRGGREWGRDVRPAADPTSPLMAGSLLKGHLSGCPQSGPHFGATIPFGRKILDCLPGTVRLGTRFRTEQEGKLECQGYSRTQGVHSLTHPLAHARLSLHVQRRRCEHPGSDRAWSPWSPHCDQERLHDLSEPHFLVGDSNSHI